MSRVGFQAICVFLCMLTYGCIYAISNDGRRIAVTVAGRVERPGIYSFMKGASIQEGIDRAGGIYQSNYVAVGIVVVHSNRPSEEVKVLQRLWRTTTMQDGDTVRVPTFGF